MMVILTWKRKMGAQALQRCAKAGENCTVVSIDCCSLWFGTVVGCVANLIQQGAPDINIWLGAGPRLSPAPCGLQQRRCGGR